jgi:hypothetical protein
LLIKTTISGDEISMQLGDATSVLLQLGVGGTVLIGGLYYVDRIVGKIVARKNGNGNGNGNGTAGEKSPAYWEGQFSELGKRMEGNFVTSLKLTVVPVLTELQTTAEGTKEILREMKDENRKVNEALIRLLDRDEQRARAAGAGI